MRCEDHIGVSVRAYAGAVAAYRDFSADYSSFPGLLDAFDEFIARIPPKAMILDVGCGAGRDARYLASRSYSVVALDACAPLLAGWPASGPGQIHRIQADFRSLPLRDGSVAAAWGCASLLHLQPFELKPTFADLARVVRGGGVVAVTMRDLGGSGWSQNAVIPDPRWVTVAASASVEHAMRTAGFEDVASRRSGEDGWYVCSGVVASAARAAASGAGRGRQ